MCLGMNEDQVGEEERCASTSNRNFEGRQGRKARTHLLSPAMAAAAAAAGHLWTFHANNSRQRGVIAVILVVFLAAGGLSFLLLNDSVGYFQNFKEQRRLRDEKKVAEAQQSLLNTCFCVLNILMILPAPVETPFTRAC